MGVINEAINGIDIQTATPGSAVVLIPSKGVDRKIKLGSFGFGFNPTNLTSASIAFIIGQKTYNLDVIQGSAALQIVVGSYVHNDAAGSESVRPFTLYERDPSGRGFRLQRGVVTNMPGAGPLSATPAIVVIKHNFPDIFPDELWLPAGEEVSWLPTITGTGAVSVTLLGVGIERG